MKQNYKKKIIYCNNTLFITIALFLVVILTVIFSRRIIPYLLMSVNNKNIGVIHKISGFEIQALLEDTKVKSIILVKNDKDAENMAKKYEKLLFGSNFQDYKVNILQRNKDFWRLELRAKNPSEKTYYTGGEYFISPSGELLGFQMLDFNTKSSAALNNESVREEASKAAKEILQSLGYEDDYTLQLREHDIVITRLSVRYQPMYLSFGMYENKLYLLNMKGNWTD
ncbi:hypothetical protein AC231_05045 [Clostridium pasteurianum]|uniref:Con-6 family protein n=1 Tax=Clostridium pasteurianum TaxID=1501 RepID=UPI0002A77672|nr:Con-6 family protein [Clostridium pasteurianum]AOZ75795.1 hypothetical protein AQ983_12115 [Clostridium pasteurianum DSM 525 = ATCC 6013]AOZ79591.1 hypothetical protein AQ984_12110 [Clostridium pasteurianum]ELP57958.1 hypothetical protein F502_17195 [Clostridium pasteurianum DSM 525 = ATCC 6013]OMH20141.1 hypothetical protein AC231_05045 [Clostridium pasteurianum]UZW12761.1 Con-6 family protein [Clostridium pasteurianum]